MEPDWGQNDVPTIKMANHAENGQIMWKISDNDDDNDYSISSSTLCAAPIFRQTHIDMITQNLQDSEVYSTNGIGMASRGEAQAHHPLNPL